MSDSQKKSSEIFTPDNKTPMTFGDLYSKIKSEAILSPEEQKILQDKFMQKYGFRELMGKQKEIVGINTRHELEELLSDLPQKGNILSKLDTILPGKEKLSTLVVESTEKTSELAKK